MFWTTLLLEVAAPDESDMKQEQPMDVASEPVDLNNDASYMDTGVLHTGRVCTECAESKAAKGSTRCADCQKGEKP